MKITIKSLRPRGEGGAKRRIRGRNSRVSAILCSRNSHKCAICCCRDNRKSVTSYNGNKHRTVIRRSKNKLQIVILCIEIFNTYIKFNDKISVFSLLSPPCTQHFWKRGVGKNTFRRKGFSPHLFLIYKKIISLQRRWRCGILRKECRQFPAATRWLL